MTVRVHAHQVIPSSEALGQRTRVTESYLGLERVATTVTSSSSSEQYQAIVSLMNSDTPGRRHDPLDCNEPRKETAMADPDPRHQDDPMNPGLPTQTPPLNQDEQTAARSPHDCVTDVETAKRSPSTGGPVPGRTDATDRNQCDEDSPGEALAREGKGQPTGDIPEPNEPA